MVASKTTNAQPSLTTVLLALQAPAVGRVRLFNERVPAGGGSNFADLQRRERVVMMLDEALALTCEFSTAVCSLSPDSSAVSQHRRSHPRPAPTFGMGDSTD
jgi:hypothetical protein